MILFHDLQGTQQRIVCILPENLVSHIGQMPIPFHIRIIGLV